MGIALLVVLVAGGGFLLLSGDDGDDAATTDDTSGSDGGDPDGPETTEVAETAFDPERLTGTWEGTYECSRGPTGLRLWVDDYGDGTVGAGFDFYPLDDGSDVEPGVFSLEGTYEGSELDMSFVEWAAERHPEGYEPVDLQATVTGTDTMEVTLDAESCEPFSLERTTMEPWYVGTFEGVYGCTQGVTGMTIEIQADEQDWAEAFVEFYEVDESTSEIPYGSFYMTGHYEERSLYFTGGDWVEQPTGYTAVDLYSYAEAPIDPYRFYGHLDNASCQLFAFERIEPDGEFGPGGSDGEGGAQGEDDGGEGGAEGETETGADPST